MISERPSQKKVVGVARKYLQGAEAAERSLRSIERFKSEEMDLGELSGLSYAIGFTVMAQLVILPFQARRRSFLRYSQIVEGFAPGEENLDVFALRVAHVSDNSYPLVRKSLQK